MKKFISIVVFFLFLSSVIVLAQDQPVSAENTDAAPVYRYDLGDQIYSVSLAPLINLFIWTPDESTPVVTGSMKVGGYISLGWEAFIDHKSSIGAELGYGFARSLDKRLYISVPILAKYSYFIIDGDFDLPISISIGGVYSSFDDQHYFGLMTKPEMAFYWNINEEWGIGLRTAYWFIPELYFGDERSKTSFGNFLTIQAAVKYTQ
ncbi:MAG: hypothetical protein H8D23_33915 [Candidatus Brocadiales bacterium]|nr:hypothetical protein [Candidatus Brocadiales bacterium]